MPISPMINLSILRYTIHMVVSAGEIDDSERMIFELPLVANSSTCKGNDTGDKSFPHDI